MICMHMYKKEIRDFKLNTSLYVLIIGMISSLNSTRKEIIQIISVLDLK